MAPATSSKRTRKSKSQERPQKKESSEKAETRSALPSEVMQELKEIFTRGTLPQAKPRDNIVMTRLWNSDLRIVDALISLEIFKSRSEAVAFLVHEGIQAKKLLVDTILPAIEQIEEIKRLTREQAVHALHKSKRAS